MSKSCQYTHRLWIDRISSLSCSLLPLTGDHGEEPCPKALLPISNKPMLDYTLSWVEQSGVKGGFHQIACIDKWLINIQMSF